MGNLHSRIRLLSGRRESQDEEEGGAPTTLPPDRRQSDHHHGTIPNNNGILSFQFHGLFYKAIKGLFRRATFSIPSWWPMKTTSSDRPILPIQNPRAAQISTCNDHDPALPVQPLLTSYSDELYDNINVEGPASSQDKIISVPDSVRSECEEIICLSAVFIKQEEKEEKTSIRSSVILPIPNPRVEDYDPSLHVRPLPISDICECDNNVAEGHVSSRDSKIIYIPEEKETEKKKNKGVIRSTSTLERITWIKHYSSRHRILLVGDGDFSFSASLAVAFGRASNMIATSLDSEAFLKNNYWNAHFNITELRKRECKVMHGIDATKMADHSLLGELKFDRIIYNFPFAGFFKNLPRETQLRRHRRLVSMFMKNAREMLSENGEIHISHKTNGFHVEWKLVSVASSHRLRLIEAVEFNQLDYPGYKTKCGFGGDNNFNCNPSQTYKFG